MSNPHWLIPICPYLDGRKRCTTEFYTTCRLDCSPNQQKCTGDRPTCQACVVAGRVEQCLYDPLRRSRPGSGHSSKQYNHSVARFRANNFNAPVASSVRSTTHLEEAHYRTTLAPSKATTPTIDDGYAVSRRLSQ